MNIFRVLQKPGDTVKNIKELREMLSEILGMNKCRLDCLANLIMALIVVRTTNLTRIALIVADSTLPLSCFRRLQRFFAEAKIDYSKLATGLLDLVFAEDDKLYLALDRTNWKLGKKNINILTLAVVYKGAAIPLLWVLLDKKGNSNTSERIELFERLLKLVEVARIDGFLADREFIGKEWFEYLDGLGVPYFIRIKKDTRTSNSKGKSIPMQRLFENLTFNQFRKLRKPRRIWGVRVYLCALKLPSGELLILASSIKHDRALEIYGRRWEIETLFQCLKGRGFHFEDTRITKLDRVSRMIAVLSLAFVWAIKAGEWLNDNVRKLKVKKHGRLEQSIFRYGLDALNQAIIGVPPQNFWKDFLFLLHPKSLQPIETQ